VAGGSPNGGPGHLGYTEVPILPRPGATDAEIIISFDLADVDIFDKRYCKVLFLQGVRQIVFQVSNVS